MTKEEFLKLQIGMFITNDEDVDNPSKYCKITQFKNGQICLQPYERYGKAVSTFPFWVAYSDINITQKLGDSEYYSLSREYQR